MCMVTFHYNPINVWIKQTEVVGKHVFEYSSEHCVMILKTKTLCDKRKPNDITVTQSKKNIHKSERHEHKVWLKMLSEEMYDCFHFELKDLAS